MAKILRNDQSTTMIIVESLHTSTITGLEDCKIQIKVLLETSVNLGSALSYL